MRGDAMTRRWRRFHQPSFGLDGRVVSKGMANKPIFFDASGRRAARIKVVGWVVGLAALVILAGFITSLVLSPPVTGLNLPGGRTVTAPNLIKRAEKPGLLPRAQR